MSLLLIALALRLLAAGWDAGAPATSLHPDERQVGYVTERIDGWFSDPGFFAYGSLHFQAIRLVAAVTAAPDGLRGLVVSGRMLSIAASILSLLLGWWMADRAWGRKTANLFLVIAAFVPLDLQQSHFATVEAHHTAWIMLALAGCFWLGTGGGTRAAAAAGAAVGASLAVKVASLALGLPLGLALLVAARRRGVLELFRLAAVATATGVIAFWVCQPWAFAGGRAPLPLMIAAVVSAGLFHLASRRSPGVRGLVSIVAFAAAAFAVVQGLALVGGSAEGGLGSRFAGALLGAGVNPEYLAGVGEQVRMVMGEADLPYVRVFSNTLPVLYPLRELALWGWGPLMVATVIAAAMLAGWVLVRRWRRLLTGRFGASTVLLIVLLSWLVPMTLRLSTLYVKYLRYWEPLVVPAVLMTAWLLARLPAPLRRRASLTVVAGTVLWGVAYLWAFVDPHPHGIAARWLTPLLEPGQVVAFESWDETIGLQLEDGAVEILNLPSYDLPDDDAKVRRWCAKLERADWVVLTSNRVMKTILANPHRFERTARLYRLLLSGESGFELLARANRGPRFFGLRWPVQLADESFVNYEFPQVLIFRRTGPVEIDALAEKVSRPLPFAEDVGLVEVQRRIIRSVPVIPSVPRAGRQLVDLGLWLIVFAVLGLSTWALLLPLLRRLPDAGIGLSLTTGWIAAAFVMWFGSELHWWPTGAATATWLLLLIGAGGALAVSARWREIEGLWRRRRGAIAAVIVVTVSVAALFLLVRAFNPAIHWGEKPMDFSFLNAFLRADAWPTGEPWMAGMPLHYYYFGQVLAAFPILVTGCTSGVGYNLMAATVPGLAASALAGLGLLLAGRRNRRAAALLPVLVLLTGNLAWLQVELIKFAGEGKWFDLWWATSRVIPGFAIDEYPLWTAIFADLHGHFIALPVLIMTLAWGWLAIHARKGRWVLDAGLAGIGAAVLVATNPWDVFVLGGALGIGALTAARHRVAALSRLAAAAAVSVIAAAPFIVELAAGISAGAGSRGLFLTAQDFAPAWAVLGHFGVFLIPLGVLALSVLGRRVWLVLPLAGAGVFAGLSFGSSAAALALAFAAGFVIMTVRSDGRWLRLAWSLAAFGAVAIAACERFTLIDRMNTIFKVYNGVWLLFAAALATLVFRSRGRPRVLLLSTWIPLMAVATVNLPLGIGQGWLQPRMSSPRPTLDGQAFLAKRDPETWFFARALQGAARPGDTVAESAGNYYSRHTRIVMHTGQPTVIGWKWHLTQRGQSEAEIMARFTDLELLYAGGDANARREVLDRYRVRWVVLGDLERQAYGLAPDATLVGVPGVVEVASQDGALLYLVVPADGALLRAPAPTPSKELPPGVEAIGALPRPQSVVRSLCLDEDGALAILADGRLVALDGAVKITDELEKPGCDPASAARYDGEVWVLCGDGRLTRSASGVWRAAGVVVGAEHLTADDRLWAWGRGGLWQLGRSEPRLVADGPIAAAAANGVFAAWSDGVEVRIGRGEGRAHGVGSTLDGVRALAWQGSTLWALDSTGLHSSGGGILPWRQTPGAVDPDGALAGGPDALWIVRSDGVVLSSPALNCSPPWVGSSGDTTSSLAQPRGLALSPDGWFAAVDTMHHRIRCYSDGGVCLEEFGSEGGAPGFFHEPSGLDIADDGRLAVADTWNGRVQIIRPDGEAEVVADQLFGPREVLWADDGGLLVADTGNRRVLRLSPPSWDKEVLAELPAPVVGLAWVDGVLAAATPAAGFLAVVDPTSGAVLRTLDVPGWDSGEQQEGYLAVLPGGELVASAPQPGEIWVIDPEGTAEPRLLRGELPGVTDMVVRADGILIASLTWDNRLVRFDLER